MPAVPPLAILNYLSYLSLAYYRNPSKVLKEKSIQFFLYIKKIKLYYIIVFNSKMWNQLKWP